MSFPSSPTNGQIYKDLKWDSSIPAWVPSGTLDLESIEASDTPAFSGYDSITSNRAYSDSPFLPAIAEVNNGNHFNMSTGLFTVPIEGVYLCKFDSLLRTADSVASYAQMLWKLDGVRASGNMHSMHAISRSYEPFSMTIAIYATVGQKIGLYISTPSAQVYGTVYTRETITFVG